MTKDYKDFWNQIRRGSILQLDAPPENIEYTACTGRCFKNKFLTTHCEYFMFKNFPINLLIVDKECRNDNDEAEFNVLCLTPEHGICNLNLGPVTFSCMKILIP